MEESKLFSLLGKILCTGFLFKEHYVIAREKRCVSVGPNDTGKIQYQFSFLPPYLAQLSLASLIGWLLRLANFVSAVNARTL